MTRYFVAANVWLILALIVFLGRTYERSDPTMYSCLHAGQLFSAEGYLLFNFGVTLLSALFFALILKTRPKQ